MMTTMLKLFKKSNKKENENMTTQWFGCELRKKYAWVWNDNSSLTKYCNACLLFDNPHVSKKFLYK